MQSTKHKRSFLVRTWDYFRPSWEGNDGRFSYKRACQFVFTGLLVYMVKKGVESQWSFYTFLTVAVLFALVAAIMSVPQFLELTKNIGAIRNNTFTNPGAYPLNDNIHEEDINATAYSTKPNNDQLQGL